MTIASRATKAGVLNWHIEVHADTENDIEVMPTLPANAHPYSSKGSVNTADNEVEYRQKPNKRPRFTKEDTASRSVTARPNSPEESGKVSNDEPKG